MRIYFSILSFVLCAIHCTQPIPYTESAKTLSPEIGVKQYLWLDESRVDDYYGGNRIVNAQVWYPIDQLSKDSIKAPYYFKINEAFDQLNSWSKKDLKEVNAVQTEGFLNAPISQAVKQFPLLVFSPSLGGNLSQYTFYAEYFCKKGYIVLGINHLYESEYAIDPKGQVRLANFRFHDSLKTLDIPSQITADEYRAAKGERQKVLGEDLIFSIDQLQKESFFIGKIKDSQIGAFGHSMGGAAVIYASLIDKRIKAVIDLDGTPPTIALNNWITAPFLFIEDLIDYKNHKGYAKVHARRNKFCQNNKNESWRILLAGTNHNSFSDINFYLSSSPSNKEEAYQNLEKTVNFMNAFFDYVLHGTAHELNEVQSDSLEIFYFPK